MKMFFTSQNSFAPEDRNSALARYQGFGRDLLDRLAADDRELFERLRFFRRSLEDDLFAEYDDGNVYFAIQLDPQIEVVVLWNANQQEEIGDWHSDAVGFALHRLKSSYRVCT